MFLGPRALSRTRSKKPGYFGHNRVGAGRSNVMKVLLLSPASEADRCARNKYVMYAPMTLPMLAALTPAEHEVRVVDEKVEPIDFDETPDIVGITALTGTANRSYEVARRFRDKGCTVVMGGPHPSVLPHEALQHADAVVVKHAYRSWPRLLRDFEDGRMKRMYVDDLVPDEKIPIPRREVLRPDGYFTLDSIQATIGCPYRCEFCVVPSFMGKRYLARDVDHILEEIAGMKSSRVFFLDVNLTANPKFAKRLFREMIPLEKEWAAQVTSKFTQDPELLDVAAQAGCRGVFIGVESLNQDALDASSKVMNSAGYFAEMQQRLRDHDICSMLGIVYGFDDDDAGVFDRTMRFMDRVKADSIRYGILTPFPGTPLFDRLHKQGRIFDYNWDRYDSCHVVYRPTKMSAEQLYEGYVRSLKHTYSLPSIIRRLLGSRSCLRLSVPVNYGYNRQTARLHHGGVRSTGPVVPHWTPPTPIEERDATEDLVRLRKGIERRAEPDHSSRRCGPPATELG